MGVVYGNVPTGPSPAGTITGHERLRELGALAAAPRPMSRATWIKRFTDHLWNLMGSAGGGLTIGAIGDSLIFGEFVIGVLGQERDPERIDVLVTQGRWKSTLTAIEGGTFVATVEDDTEAVARRVMELLVALVGRSQVALQHCGPTG
jgi:hypothetical protein